MLYRLLLPFFYLLPFILNGQNISYPQWEQETEINLRLLPKYGNKQKNKVLQDADKNLIDTYLPLGAKEEVSDFLISKGFEYITQGDLKTAMYRFNQAWLANPENENVFWGFGTVYFTFQDYEKALEQYNTGLELNPENIYILTDKASIYLVKFYINRDRKALDQALKLLTYAYSLDNQNPNVLFKLSGGYFFKQDCENTVRYFKECEILNNEIITEEFREAVTKKCLL